MTRSNERQADEGPERDDTRAPHPRRPYEPPQIASGPAFERVHLASDCNNFNPVDGCDIIC